MKNVRVTFWRDKFQEQEITIAVPDDATQEDIEDGIASSELVKNVDWDECGESQWELAEDICVVSAPDNAAANVTLEWDVLRIVRMALVVTKADTTNT